jgi:hypothetical protein
VALLVPSDPVVSSSLFSVEYEVTSGLGLRFFPNPEGIESFSPGLRGTSYPYMFLSVPFFLVASVSFRELPLAGLWNEGERSEPSGTAQQGAVGFFGSLTTTATKSCFPVLLLLSLLRQGIKTGPAAQVAPVAYMRSCYPRAACGQPVTQPDPCMPSALNSNCCLNRGPGPEFACIRQSRNTLPAEKSTPCHDQKYRSCLCRRRCG